MSNIAPSGMLINLWCIVCENCSIFKVTIGMGNDLIDLRKVIKEEKPNYFANINADELTLWKTNVASNVLRNKETAIELYLNEKLKDPADTVGNTFQKVIGNNIQVIVGIPITEQPVTGKRKVEDSNEELDNKKVRQIEGLSPESIAKFLEEQKGVKDDFTKPHDLCINRFSFQRKGRDETLHKIYDCIVERYISIKNTLEEKKSVSDKSLHPILMLQATPGGGKSFLLDELAALKSEDFDNYLKSKEQPNRKCPFILENAVYHKYIEIVNDVIDILRNSIVVCITYNGNSTYKNDSPVDANVQRGLVMRILWSYFFDDAKLSWQGFCEKFNTNFESLDIYIAIQSILYHSKKRVFLCVDETMKISPNTDDVNRRQCNINELLNNLYSPYQGLVNDEGKLINFNFILTTLDAVYMQTNSPYSGRTIDWVPLRRLNISESTDLFHKILNDKELNEKRKYLIRKCISDCNGHPRTLEKFYELLRKDETALSIDMYGSLISRLVNKILSSLAYIKFSIIKTALLGNNTDLTHNINTLNKEYSISDLISIGVYINSLTKVEETVSVVPTLTLISLQYFCNMYEEEGNKEGDAKIVVKILKNMLETECYFDGNVNDGKPFESFHCNWEQLYRVLREERKEVSLHEVYRLSDAYNTTTKGDVEIILQRKKIIKLDRSVEFPPRDGKICGEQGVFINKNFEEYIFVPEKTNNSSFDMTIFEKKVGGGHIALNIECRFSYPERSTTLTSKEIREKYDLMKEKYRYHVKQEKIQNVTRKQRKDSKVELVNSDTPIGEFGMTMEDIYLVIIAWRDINALDSDIKNNKNIIIVGKDSLEKAYTPTLVTRPQFYDNILQDHNKISQEVTERVNK